MKMKRILAVALALAMGLSMISCSQSTEREETQPQSTEEQVAEQPAKTPEEKPTEKPTEKTKVNLSALSGPTALGMLELLEQNGFLEIMPRKRPVVLSASPLPQPLERLRQLLKHPKEK